jgi:DNA-binding NtrC family response regulator
MTKQRKHSVIVVDDESSVLFTYKLLLEQQGYNVTAVASSALAQDELKKSKFDLLLCDLSLEENHNGFEVIEFARKCNPNIACVLLTGYASVEAAQKAADMGVTVLYKPIDIQEFLTTIPAVLKEKYEQTKAARG